MDDIKNIFDKFKFRGELISFKPFGSGHINSTYIAEYNENGKIRSYIIQKVNTNVFKNIDDLMGNVFAVTSFLREKIKNEGGNPHRETLHYIKTADGDLYYRDENNNCYRAYRFVDNSKCLESVDCPAVFEKSGVVFGKFQKYLADFPASTLKEIIPNFHNTAWRFENEFLLAVEVDSEDRVKECKKEIEFVLKHRNICSRLTDLADKGEIPVRVTHNDTKLNNVLFDNDTDDAICVIDLDTVMPGLALYDFGDSIRFGANTCAEDEKDVSKVAVNLEYFEAYARGFLSQAGGSLCQTEKDNLAFSALLMTFECGMRFLTDFLNGDTYFKTSYDRHNLVRAENQFALVSDMEKHMDEMEKIISKF